MRENRFFTVTLAVAMAVLFLLSVANVLSGSESERYRISVIVDDSASGRWFSFREGLNQAARDNNIELSFLTTDRLASLQQEGRLITREIQNGTDGIIVGFRSSQGTMEMIAGYTGQTTLALVDTEVERDGTGSDLGSVLPDNVGMAEALAAQILQDTAAERAKGVPVRIGIAAGNQQQRSLQERLSTLQAALSVDGVEISWEISGEEEIAEKIWGYHETSPVDILVSLDNAGTEAVLKGQENEAVQLYGIGNSDSLVFALDGGSIRCLVVPEEFNMGYYALSDLAALLNHRLIVPEKRTIGYRVVTRENMYDEENQRILFPKIE